MDAKEIRATALANLIARGLDPKRVFSADELEGLRTSFAAIESTGELPLAPTEQRRAMSGLEVTVNPDAGTSQSGRRSFENFVKDHVDRRIEELEEQAWNTFAHFDIDADGFVDRVELSRLVDAGASPEDVAAVIAAADDDGDGRIDYAEFLAWYTDHHDVSGG